ncbi:MAG: cation diffusion facilitator family transporter [bacterium]|nr:cation diffusion facilitator family transporter [bacterium]
MNDNHHHENLSNIRLVLFLNLGFSAFEFVGGVLTNSMAILADAVHDLGDGLALGLAFFLEKRSVSPGDHRYSYGYRRFSLLGALITAALLIFGSLYILSVAIPRLLRPEHSNAQGMLIFALIGVVVNGIGALRMMKSHGLNARMVTWHLVEDILGWLAVLVVAAVMLFRDIPILDPALSCLIALYVLYRVLVNLKKTLTVVMQGVPEDVDMPQIEKELKELSGVRSAHHTHIWSLDGEQHVLSTHLVVDEKMEIKDLAGLKETVREVVARHKIAHSTVEIEFPGEVCRSQTDSCYNGAEGKKAGETEKK